MSKVKKIDADIYEYEGILLFCPFELVKYGTQWLKKYSLNKPVRMFVHQFGDNKIDIRCVYSRVVTEYYEDIYELNEEEIKQWQ